MTSLESDLGGVEGSLSSLQGQVGALDGELDSLTENVADLCGALPLVCYGEPKALRGGSS